MLSVGEYGLNSYKDRWPLRFEGEHTAMGHFKKGRDVTLGSDPPGQEGGARASLRAGEGGLRSGCPGLGRQEPMSPNSPERPWGALSGKVRVPCEGQSQGWRGASA